MKEIPWGERARLCQKIYFEQGPPREEAVYRGDLNTLVQMAFLSGDGKLKDLVIKTESGSRFEAGEIACLALRADRPRLQQ
jgi:hypothetical protein